MEYFILWLTLEVGHSGAPGVEDFSLWLTLGVGHSSSPDVEDFSLWLNLDELTVPCPSRGSFSLWTGRKYGQSLVEHLVGQKKIQVKDFYDGLLPIDGTQHSHDTTCQPKIQDELEQATGHKPRTG